MKTIPQLAHHERQALRKGYLHPFQRRTIVLGLSLVDVAFLLGIDVSVVKAWVRAKDSRRVPIDVAQEIYNKWGLPPDEASWPNGISPRRRLPPQTATVAHELASRLALETQIRTLQAEIERLRAALTSVRRSASEAEAAAYMPSVAAKDCER